MTVVSVVSGTYNRLEYLRNMVYSVRYSVGTGIPYEIVLVDGGSTDGTLEWAQEQSDVRLIRHGELLGAVKAFNDGAYAAKGNYVILANDDVVFGDESIQAAVSFMQDNPDIGIGCFYQDRRGWDWHVEEMPAVKDGKQVSVPYGQVCIVLKWLGDHVGWWGNYLRTYGGDNELSCRVLELGYKVAPVPLTKIHDVTPADTLRELNNPKKGPHPDSTAWVAKWTRKGKTGPIIKDVPFQPNPIQRKLRILYVPIYEAAYPIQRQQKRGLRDALAKVSLVTEYDYVAEGVDRLFDLACAFEPDIFLMQVQGVGSITAETIRELRSHHAHALFVNWNGDYHPEVLFDPKYILLESKFDLCGLVTTVVKEKYDEAGINWFYWQIGYEDPIGVIPVVPTYDVLFMGNGYSEERLQLAKLLRGLECKVGIYGYWPNWVKSNGSTLYDFTTGAELCKKAKIIIGDSQWPNATGFVSNRLFQTMAAGGLLLQQEFDGLEDLLGLRDGEHLIVWKTMKDLPGLISNLLRPEMIQERKRIAKTGQEFILKNHSFDVRVQELLRKLR